MAFTGSNDWKVTASVKTCGGLARTPQNYRGVGVISGITKAGPGAGVATPCRVFLFSTDNTLLSFKRTDGTGLYSFVGLAPGTYMLLVQDENANDWRGKTEYVVVPAPAPPTPPTDPYWENVALLLHFDAADATRLFYDEKRNQWDYGGAAAIRTAQSKFGGSSMQPGALGYITTVMHRRNAPFGMAVDEFTVEGWVYPTSASTRGVFDSLFGSSTYGVALGWNNTVGSTQWEVYFAGAVYVGPVHALTLNAWQHFAVVKSWDSGANNYVVTLYIDGVVEFSFVPTAQDTPVSRGFTIGAYSNNTFPWIGYIDEFRVTLGVARYTAPFTPPTSPF